MEQHQQEQPDALVVVDVPLLYESGLETMFEQIMVVYVPVDLQLRRLMERDGLTQEQAEARIASQLSIEEKRHRADYVIDNGGTLEATERQVDTFWQDKGL